MTPLMNFVAYLLTALGKESKDLFGILKTQYKISLKRDKDFEALLDKIAYRFSTFLFQRTLGFPNS